MVSEPLFISIHLLYPLEIQHIWCTQAFQQFQCAQKELCGLDFELGALMFIENNSKLAVKTKTPESL